MARTRTQLHTSARSTHSVTRGSAGEPTAPTTLTAPATLGTSDALTAPATLTVLTALTTLVALALGLGACKREMVTPPYVMDGDAGREVFARVDPAFQSSEMPVLFVTDRAIDKTTAAGPQYGFGRSRTLDYGVATVSIDQAPSWDELVANSTTVRNHRPQTITVSSVEKLGEFAPLMSRLGVSNGVIDLRPGAVDEIHAERQEFAAALDRWLEHTPRKEAFVYVHGFANTFDDAVTRLAESWHYGGRQAVPIAFTWPAGSGGLTGYAYDRESGEFAVLHLKLLLMALAENPRIERVHIISHSRGTDVASTALRELHMEVRAATGRGAVGMLSSRPILRMTPEQIAAAPTTAEYLKIRTLVLAAPDLNIDVFSQRFMSEGAIRAAERTIVYFSQDDGALAAAQWLFSGGNRVGDLSIDSFTPQQLEFLASVPSFEAITCETKGYSSHSYMFMHPSAFSDLLLVLRDQATPGPDGARPLEQPKPGLWLLRNDYLKPAASN